MTSRKAAGKAKSKSRAKAARRPSERRIPKATAKGAPKGAAAAKPSKGKAEPRDRGTAPSHGADNGDLLDMKAAIAMLKTTRATFYRWLREGKIEGMKVGRQWRFERREIDRFLRGEAPRVALRADIAPLISALKKQLRDLGVPDPASETQGASELRRAVSLMVHLGVALNASDIHAQPAYEDGEARRVDLRYRVDGVLQTRADFDIRLLAAVVGEWKSMAGCDVRELRRPQDGRAIVDVGGRNHDLRVCFLPTVLGEAVTARILSPTALVSLEDIQYADADRERLMAALAEPWGLIVVSGPTGSGKTTVLYSCLNHVISPRVKVMTVEDPVEYILPGTTQTRIDPAAGVTFAAAARSCLRSDPDVIMIGEIRDKETLHMALTMSLTGHLVFTTLHTDEAARGLTRMIEMGVEPFLVGDATKLVLTQRLVRLLCVECKRPTTPSAALLARAREAAVEGGLDWESLEERFHEGVGCPECRGLAFKKRNVIAETLKVTPEVSDALRRRASVEELRAIAVGQGMTTMAADGARRAARGDTTLDEALRVLALA